VRLPVGEGLVPLLGDRGEVLLQVLQRLGLKAEEPLAAGRSATDNTGTFENAKVLRDRLASELGIVGKLRNRSRLAGTEPGNQGKARLVTECGKHACLGLGFSGDAFPNLSGHRSR